MHKTDNHMHRHRCTDTDTHTYKHTHMYTNIVVIFKILNYQDRCISTTCFPRWRHRAAQVKNKFIHDDTHIRTYTHTHTHTHTSTHKHTHTQ